MDETKQPVAEQANEQLPDLNNFYGYLPGGMYRDDDKGKNKQAIMDAIDQIIIERGNGDEIKKANSLIEESKKFMAEMFLLLQQGKTEQAQLIEKKRNDMAKEAETIIRPLYNELIKRGFSHDLLMQ